MNKDKLKSFLIKVVLTLPALLIGIMAALVFILKPLIELWSPKDEFEKQVDQIISNENPPANIIN